MQDELRYFNQHVWRGVTKEEAKTQAEKTIRTRWVLCNKGDAAQPEVRARLVACEINHGHDDSGQFYANPPR